MSNKTFGDSMKDLASVTKPSMTNIPNPYDKVYPRKKDETKLYPKEEVEHVF
nr:hypothetical protein 2 [Bacillaceae bacterium]